MEVSMEVSMDASMEERYSSSISGMRSPASTRSTASSGFREESQSERSGAVRVRRAEALFPITMPVETRRVP